MLLSTATFCGIKNYLTYAALMMLLLLLSIHKFCIEGNYFVKIKRAFMINLDFVCFWEEHRLYTFLKR